MSVRVPNQPDGDAVERDDRDIPPVRQVPPKRSYTRRRAGSQTAPGRASVDPSPDVNKSPGPKAAPTLAEMAVAVHREQARGSDSDVLPTMIEPSAFDAPGDWEGASEVAVFLEDMERERSWRSAPRPSPAPAPAASSGRAPPRRIRSSTMLERRSPFHASAMVSATMPLCPSVDVNVSCVPKTVALMPATLVAAGALRPLAEPPSPELSKGPEPLRPAASEPTRTMPAGLSAWGSRADEVEQAITNDPEAGQRCAMANGGGIVKTKQLSPVELEVESVDLSTPKVIAPPQLDGLRRELSGAARGLPRWLVGAGVAAFVTLALALALLVWALA